MFYNRKIHAIEQEIQNHTTKIIELQKTYEQQAFYVTMIELSKESSLAQLKNNKLNNIQFNRSTITAIVISAFSVIITCVIFIIQITDKFPSSSWQKEQTNIQKQILEATKNLTSEYIHNNYKLDSLVELNKELIQLIQLNDIGEK